MKYFKVFEDFDFDDEEEEEDDLLELAGLKGKYKISKEVFDAILACDDFNDAIFNTQNAIGQDDGGGAGIYFSDNDDLDEMWANGDREEIIINYLKFEQDDEIEDEDEDDYKNA